MTEPYESAGPSERQAFATGYQLGLAHGRAARPGLPANVINAMRAQLAPLPGGRVQKFVALNHADAQALFDWLTAPPEPSPGPQKPEPDWRLGRTRSGDMM